jgi:hypothetical protein
MSTSEAIKRFALGGQEQLGSAINAAKGSTWLLPAIAVIVVLVLVAIIVFVVLQYKQTAPKSETKGPIDLWAPGSAVFVSRDNTNKYMKGNWTFAFYVRFDAVPDMRTDVPFLVWPGSWALDYNPAQETLLWKVNAAPDGSYGATQQVIRVPGVPLQRWTQVLLTLEGRTLDAYINGSLVLSDQLTNVPQMTSGSITIQPNNIMGQAAYIQLWGRRLTGGEISGNYADTSDSQGRPMLGPALFQAFKGLSLPNLFCPSGNCSGSSPSAQPSQTWEFPYA